MTDLASLLACPRCGTPLAELRCRACRLTFPAPGGVAWLFADPGAAVSEWQNRWRLAEEQMEADLRRVESALSVPDQTEPTRRRLNALAAGYRAQRSHLRTLLDPLARTSGGALETLLALRTRMPPSQGIFSYEANAHRDWCWGDRECETAVEAVIDALADHAPRNVLVLGAGAGRLAYDLHRLTPAALTVALDVNPLLAYVGARVSAGTSVELVEFPRAPRLPEGAAVQRTLAAPAAARPGLEFVLADASRPPFRPGSFDVVVTPWLLDVMDEPPINLLRRINPLLDADGLWINQGSVAFDRPDPAERVTLDELLELAPSAGFDTAVASDRTTPYMDCPDSRHGRLEAVVTLRGRKCRTEKSAARRESLPPWIVTGKSPIPALPAFTTQAMATRMHAFIMTLIDGQRSLEDIAQVLDDQKLLPRQQGVSALRGFLTTMYDESQRGGRPDC